MNKTPCIGLFGTCGSSRWRDAFIQHYTTHNVEYFNPQKDDWKPEDSQIEADHLINDDVILFPITDETFGTGSLAETGYSILSAIRSNSQRFVIIYIDPQLQPELFTLNPLAAKESSNARAIVLAHLKHAQHPNVFVVDSLDQMLSLSLKLYTVAQMMSQIDQEFRPTTARSQSPRASL